MDRRRVLQGQVRRDRQRHVTAQRIVWSISALIAGIALVIFLFKMQDTANRPEHHAKRYLENPKLREAYRAPSYQKITVPSLDNIEVVSTKLIQKLGEKDDSAVDVWVTLRGREVVGTSQAIKDQEAGKKGPTHEVVMHWQKLRDGQIAANGKWMLLEMRVAALSQQAGGAGVPMGAGRR